MLADLCLEALSNFCAPFCSSAIVEVLKLPMKYPNFLATCIILHNICLHSLLCWKGRGEKKAGCTHFSINICSKDRKVFCTHPVYKSDYIMLINWRSPNSLSPMSQCICLGHSLCPTVLASSSTSPVCPLFGCCICHPVIQLVSVLLVGSS